MVKKYDVVIIGAGASGLMAASVALSRGKTVAVIEMGGRPARKVAVSGGGNCNLTNTSVNFIENGSLVLQRSFQAGGDNIINTFMRTQSKDDSQ